MPYCYIQNKTNKSLVISDIPACPVIEPGKIIDLLLYASTTTISSSKTLSSLIKSKKVNIIKVSNDFQTSVSANTDVIAALSATTGTDNPHSTTLEQVRTANNQIYGNIDANNNTIINLSTPINSNDAATKTFVDLHQYPSTQVTDFQTEVSTNTDVAANTAARHTHANKSQLDLIADGLHDTRTNNPHSTTLEQARTANNQITGNIDANGHTIINLSTPSADTEAATKAYVDSSVTTGLIWQTIVIDIQNTPPVSPTSGDRYIVDTVPTGAWVGQAKAIATYTVSWAFSSPSTGWATSVTNQNSVYRYNGSSWAPIISAISDHGALSGLLDDDHSQYLNTTRGDVRYYTKTEIDSLLIQHPTVTKTGDYTVTTANYYIFVDTSTNNVNITLYTAVGNAGREIYIKKITTDGNSLTITPQTNQLIDGQTSLITIDAWTTLKLVSSGAHWYII